MSILTRLPHDEADRVQRKLSDELLSSPTEFDLESLRRRNWVAAPVRDEITDEQAIWIAAAIADLGESKGLCVTTEPQIGPEAYEVELTDEGLHRFHYNCRLTVFVLAPESLSFALLDEADYFYVLAGPRPFVEASLGRPLEEAMGIFLEYARTVPESERTRKWLTDTAERYRLAPRA